MTGFISVTIPNSEFNRFDQGISHTGSVTSYDSGLMLSDQGISHEGSVTIDFSESSR
jgi:hypothetical protein